MRRLVLVFLISFLVYTLSWVVVYSLGINKTLIQSEDTYPALYLPVSIIEKGTFYLDDYCRFLACGGPENRKPFYLVRVGEHYLSFFPIGASILALPVYFFPLKFGLPVNSFNIAVLGKISAALMVAGSAVFVYFFLREFLEEKLSLALALVYAFGSCSFGLSSQSLWQHGVSQLMLAAALFCLVRGLKDERWALWAGLFLGLATLSRYINAISVVFLSVFYLRRFGLKGFSKYIALGLVPLSLLLIYNHTYFGSFANQGYAGQIFKYWLGPFPGGFLGEWFSPSKGILTYSPIFIFSLLGMWLFLRKKSEVREGLFGWISTLVIIHSLVVGKWVHWFGGWAFGYRMMVDMTPYLVFLWIPLVKSAWWGKVKNWFWAAAVYSVAVQLMGIAFYNGSWHRIYDRGDVDQGWLWSIKDSEMVYYVRKVLRRIL